MKKNTRRTVQVKPAPYVPYGFRMNTLLDITK